MANKTQYSTAEIKTALKATRGLLSLAAEKLGCNYTTVYRRVKEVKDLQHIVQHYRRLRCDVAELALDKALANGEPWAVAMTLKTLGKSRGYVERVQQEVSGRNGKAIKIRAFRYGDAIAGIAPGSVGDRLAPGADQGGLHGTALGENSDGG